MYWSASLTVTSSIDVFLPRRTCSSDAGNVAQREVVEERARILT